jgi:hypothetical protein
VGTGGIRGTTGGAGGSVPPASCSELATEYQTALSDAGNCTVGAPGQCQQLVSSSPYPCAGCLTYVNDSTALSAILNAWNEEGCTGVVPPCGLGACETPQNNTCISIDGGSVGYCEYISGPGTGSAGTTGGGFGGSDGSGGSGGFGGSGGGAGGAPVDGGPTGPGPLTAVLYPSPYMTGAYMLALSNVPIDCTNTMPTPSCSPAGVTYVITMQIPLGDVSPGVYALSGLINPSFSDTGPNIYTPPSCWVGVGGFIEGSLDILATTTTSLVVQLQDTLTVDFDANDVQVTAQRCPGATGPVSLP